jgi:glucosamine--fructose-6-phosphate aminotransferase (isomerizing)
MDLRQQILDSPRALRETLEKGRPEFESLVRRVPWGEGPIFMVGAGSSYLATLTGVYAFEGLLGWPVIARPSSDFEAYAVSVLRPRSVLLALSNSGETPATLDAARAARSRKAVVLALTNNPASTLAQMADLVFLLRAGEAGATSLQAVLCQQAALGFISLVAARTLKRHHDQLDVLEEEFTKLPAHVEWIQVQLLDAVRALTAEVRNVASLSVVGGGFYHPVALQAALLLKETSRVPAEGFDEDAFHEGALSSAPGDSALLVLSGSHCRVKKKIHALAARAKKAVTKTLSITDGNDRELQNSSTLSVLLPELTEMAGSTLALALLQSVACQTIGEQSSGFHRRRSPSIKNPVAS